MSANPQPETSSNDDKDESALEVLLVDDWLIFDCPGCEQTIKISRENAVFTIQCPSCSREFQALLSNRPKRAPSKAVADGTRRGRRHRRGSSVIQRPHASELPDEGLVKLEVRDMNAPNKVLAKAVLPEPRSQRPNPIPEVAADSRLPVRSALELERRRVAASLEGREDPNELGDRELNAVIEKESGGKYKRIRVRTRKKRATEKQLTRRFYTLVGLGTLSVVGLTLWAAARLYREDGALGLKKQEVVTEVASVFSEDPPIGQKLANWMGLIDQFLDAENVDQLLKCVRNPRRLEPIMREFYKDGYLGYANSYIGAELVSESAAILPDGFRVGKMRLADPKVLTFYLENTASHGYRLDWESFVGLGSIPWTTFTETRATQTARMRCIVSKGAYYEGDYADTQRWRCVRLDDIEHTHSVYGYIPLRSLKHRELNELLIPLDNETSGGELRLILDIRYPQDAVNASQVEILELKQTSWLIP